MRGQANLLSLAVALLVLTTVAGIGLHVADGAFASTDRTAAERRAAVSLSERLVSAGSPFTARANVLNRSRVSSLDPSGVRSQFPVVRDRSVRIRLGDRQVVSYGTPTGGTTIRRVVLLERRQRVQVTPPLAPPNYTTTLPRRTSRIRLTVDPPAGTSVTTVRANDRVVLRNTSGLDGTFDVRVSPMETVALSFDASGPLGRGDVTLTYYPELTTKTTLAVTVDA